MDADTSGNPWRLKIDNAYVLSPAVMSPDNISLVLDVGSKTNYPGNNFTFTEAAAEINGTVKDEAGNPFISIDVYISGDNGNFNRNVRTDAAGAFRIGFLSSELPASNVWLGSGNEDMNMVSASAQITTVNAGNIITKHLTIYRTNSTISGNVTLSGNPPNMPIEIFANVSDTGFVRTFTDLNGNYTLNVSDKLFNYNIGPGQLPPNYYGYFVTAHPGQTNVNFNFNLTDVEQDQSIIPNEFSLAQNFPNPFNPSTLISYKVKETSHIQIKVFNILGNEIKTLVDEEKPAGNYKVDFNASNFPSGVYFYRLQAGSFVETKKMILLK